MQSSENNPHRVLDALGHQTRRDILTLLRQEPHTVVGLANKLPISRPAVSKHLRVLEQADLVKFKPDGASNVFSINSAGFQTAKQFLEPFWDDALRRFKQIAEQEAAKNSVTPEI